MSTFKNSAKSRELVEKMRDSGAPLRVVIKFYKMMLEKQHSTKTRNVVRIVARTI